MATIELTLPVMVTGSGWLISMLVNVWVVSRKTQGWDTAEDHEKTLYGNPREGVPGLVQKVQTLENLVSEHSKIMKFTLSALNARGSGEHQIAEGVNRMIHDHAIERDIRADAER